MPSPNPRIQVAASPDLYAQIKTLAKARNVTLSNMVQELCLYALKTDEIRAEYQHACETYGEVPIQEDKRIRPESRPWVKNYTEEDRKKAMDVLDIKIKSDEAAEQEKWAAEEEMGFEIPPEMKKKLMENLLKKLMA